MTWEIKNTGNVEWGDKVQFKMENGDKLFVRNFQVPNANPDENVWITLNFKCFDKPGLYETHFRLAQDGMKFGLKPLTVRMNIVDFEALNYDINNSNNNNNQ